MGRRRDSNDRSQTAVRRCGRPRLQSPTGEFVAFLDGLLFGQIVGAKPTT